MKNVFCLTSTNLTGLGGMMGTERTWDNFKEYFTDERGITGIEKAKQYAEKDYKRNKGKEKIVWSKNRSQDLGFVQYDIIKLKVR